MRSALLLCVALAAPAPPCVVVVANRAHVAPALLAEAQAEAGAALAGLGVAVRWTDDVAGATADIVLATDRPAGDTHAEALGMAVLPGPLAYVYVRPCLQAAHRHGLTPARVLGLAMAHEIEHVRRGTAAHDAAGLMKADWTSADFELMRRR